MFLIRKFFTLLWVLVGLVPTVSSASIHLTEEESRWLQRHTVIQYAPTPNFPPIEYVDKTQRHLGIAPELLDLVLKQADLPLKIMRFETWEEVIEATRQGRVDMLGSVVKTPKREQFLAFTEPYITLPYVIYMREGEGFNDLTLSDLAGKRLVVIEDYASTEFIEQNFPQIPLVKVPDISTAMRMVSYEMADAIVTSQAVGNHYIQKHRLFNLEVVGNTEMNWQLRFAVRKDWPELVSILQKALDAIPDHTKDALLTRYIKADYPTQLVSPGRFQTLLLWLGAMTILLLLLSNFYLSRRLQLHRASLDDAHLQHGELLSEIQHLRTVDYTTGLATRQAFWVEAEKELARFHRYENGFAIVLLEYPLLHALKQQDNIELAAQVKKQLALIIHDEIREHDCCGDLGNGSIGIILHTANLGSAQVLIKRLLGRISNMDTGTVNHSVDAKNLNVGVALPDKMTSSIDQLIQKADGAMRAMSVSNE